MIMMTILFLLLAIPVLFVVVLVLKLVLGSFWYMIAFIVGNIAKVFFMLFVIALFFYLIG